MRTSKEYHLKDPKDFKAKLLLWSRQFSEIAWLDSNHYKQHHSNFEAVLAVDAFTALKTDYHNAFEKLQEYQQVTKDWIFGYLSYDLKNDVETLTSKNFDGLGFPDLYFFQPQRLLILKGDIVEFHYLRIIDDEMDADFKDILHILESMDNLKPETRNLKPFIQPRISKEKYLERIEQLKWHIHRGDIYEANYCQEFFSEDFKIDPVQVFKDLNEISLPPFAVFLKLEEIHLLSASPERFLKKTGQKILSQPIKGTARRSLNKEEDEKIALLLSEDPKENSENVMIVDLVRNDLSRIAKKGSVMVEELCKIYSFRQVHQLISTISAEVENGIPPVDVLRATFPMGSITGAPKISAMKIIEELEETRRGLYSGAVGYFTPSGDFDFNVVIRSILYNSKKQYVSFSVGGAITAASVPEKEYEECLLKSQAMYEALNSSLKSK